MLQPLLMSLAAGYLIGSVPVAYFVAKARGVDIFAVGTGNPGAANTFRTVGRGAGVLVLVMDVGKGAAAVLVAAALVVEPVELQVAAGAGAVVGHWYPVFLRFRGGAGLAPAIGVALATLPLPGLASLALAVLVLSRIQSTGHAAGVGFTAFLLIGSATGHILVALAVTGLGALVLLYSRLVPDRNIARGPTRH